MTLQVVLNTSPVFIGDLFSVGENEIIVIRSFEVRGESTVLCSPYSDNFSELTNGTKLYHFSLLKTDSGTVSVVFDYTKEKTSKDLLAYSIFEGTLSSSSPTYIPISVYPIFDAPLYFYFSNAPVLPDKATVLVYSGKLINGVMDYSKVKVLEVYKASDSSMDSSRFVLGYLGYDDVLKITTDGQSLGLKIIVCKWG